MNGKNHVHDVIFSAVHCGERVIWSGRPRQGMVFRGSDVLQIPFSLMWCGFAIFWEYSVVTSRSAPLFFILWGIPFVLVGVYITVGRFFWEAARRSQMHYAVTDQRILIVSNFPAHTEVSLPLAQLPQMSFASSHNGGGTITFGDHDFFNLMAKRNRPAPPEFVLREKAREVYELIRRAQRGEFTEFVRSTSRAA